MVYQGGYKYRDGTNRNMSSNLMISATPKFQVSGFDTDFYQDNTQVNTGTQVCGPASLGGLSGNRFLELATPDRLIIGSKTSADSSHGADKCDGLPKGTAATPVTASALLELVMKTVAHDSVPLSVLL